MTIPNSAAAAAAAVSNSAAAPSVVSARTIAMALGLPTPTNEQVAVIESPLSPALVVAGAGSGKTETMSARVVWLVANAMVQREEILGLTFTRKAAGELAERISRRLSRIDEFERRGLIPHLEHLAHSGELEPIARLTGGERPRRLDQLVARFGAARPDQERTSLFRPRVTTYNSFADQIMRESGSVVGADPDAGVLNSAAAWLLARRVVAESADPRLVVQDKSLSSMVEAVLNLSGAVLDHGANLNEVGSWGQQWAEQMRPLTNPDLQSPAAAENAVAALSALPLIAELSQAFAAGKAEQSVREFADQVAGALRVVQRAPSIASDLRDQYRVVLLDEYQDTSVMQADLLSQIFADTPVMAVGDPHQAIYGWRGASADNLNVFSANFAPGGASGRYTLSTSWRNDQQVLNCAQALLAGVDQTVAEVTTLQARPGAGLGQVEVSYVDTLLEEADVVARWCANNQAAGSSQNGNVDHQVVPSGAVLFRARAHMPVFAQALARHGVPYRVVGIGGLLQAPEVVDIVCALRVVADPMAGSALIRLLSGPRFAVGLPDIAALKDLSIALSKRDANRKLLDSELLESLRNSAQIDEQGSLSEAMEFMRTARSGHSLLRNFSEPGLDRIIQCAQMFTRLRQSPSTSVIDLIRQVEKELLLDIELIANESRGPILHAQEQVHALIAEVRSFIDLSGHVGLASVLAWLEQASTRDELAPRQEAPEPGVVQLVTVHGAKGLEWDYVALVRMVEEEFPKKPRSSGGWLSLGQLPHRFRGDRRALPDLTWRPEPGSTRKDFMKEIDQFKLAMASHQEAEERRLAYVAVTRARTALLLSGSWWGGQQKSRKPSKYLSEMMAALGLPEILDSTLIESPETAKPSRSISWPQDPLGSRRDRLERAAALVQQAVQFQEAGNLVEPDDGLAKLLAERHQMGQRSQVLAPVRIPASRFKDYAGNYAATVQQFYRPLPERPERRMHLGTLFHQWVEKRSGLVGSVGQDEGLWADGDDMMSPDANRVVESALSVQDTAELAQLQQNFERSPWGRLQPVSVESEINFTLAAGDDANAEPHIIICQLDAVYQHDNGRIEIVDWKTGRPPKTAAEKEERMLQLALYRLAYHRRYSVPLNQIDVTLFYVADQLIFRPDRHYSEEGLSQRLSAARAAR